MYVNCDNKQHEYFHSTARLVSLNLIKRVNYCGKIKIHLSGENEGGKRAMEYEGCGDPGVLLKVRRGSQLLNTRSVET